MSAFTPRDDEDPRAHTAASGVTRRTLLAGAGAGLLASALPARLAFAAEAPDQRLVVVFLRGAADGLSILAPVGDPDYVKARPTIALPSRRALPVSRLFGFHPDAVGLKRLYDARQLAPVVAVAAPDPTRSHFEAMERMETCSYQSSPLRTGWLDRYAAGAGLAGTFSTVALGGVAPRSFSGDVPDLAVPSVDGFRVRTRRDDKAFLDALATVNAGSSLVGVRMRAAMSAATRLQRLHGRPLGHYPDSPLGRALHDVATMVRGGLPLNVVTLDAGGWDMHEGLGKDGGVDGGWMGRQVKDLSGGLSAFATDLGREWARTTVVVMSEFGRRVGENASGGVDHGHGNTWFVAGGRVRGGHVYGGWPTLAATHLDDGDLAGRVDHRQVLADVLRSLGASARTVQHALPGAPASPLGLFR